MIQGLIESNYRQVAEGLVSMGATSNNIDIDKFAKEVESVFVKISNFQPDIVVVTDGMITFALYFVCLCICLFIF